MQYRSLGKSGLKVSELSFGSWVTFKNQIDDSSAIETMKMAYDAGVNFFDNAEVYAEGQSEVIMGRALKKLGWARDTYCVSSKVFWGGPLPTQRGLSRKHIFDACHAAMERLQVDYLDLYFCHRPDQTTPIEETVWAMNDLIRQGKILYWGTSEWSATELMEAHKVARQLNLIPPTMEQPEYNMFKRDKIEAEYIPLYKEGLGTTIWSPLASGILTNKYAGGIPKDSRMSLPGFEWLRDQLESEKGKEKIEKATRLNKIAGDLGTTLTQMALAWCLKSPHVSTVILGASKASQLKDNLKAADVTSKLTTEVMKEIDLILDNKPRQPMNWLG